MVSDPNVLPDNKAVYSTVEFHRWIGRVDLDADEKYLLGRFLRPEARTLEAGTGGGRILLALQQMGFTDLQGFDYVPGLVAQARAADARGTIRFEVQDATRLTYGDDTFDQIIYLQQLLSCMDGENAGPQASREAARILRPGGTALFSFLCFEVRARSLVYGPMIWYWRALRRLSRSPRPAHCLPWLRMGDRFNWRALVDAGPYVRWYGVREAEDLLGAAGFSVRGVATSRQLQAQRLCSGAAELLGEPLRGAIYFVCTKPEGNPRPG